MTTLGKIHVGDLGTLIQIYFQKTSINDVNSVLDISSATTKTITIKDPDGTVIATLDGDFITDGTDGGLEVTTDLTTSIWTLGGFWRWYGTAALASGEYNSSDVIREVLA